jgi:glutamate N-acetyltransferase / amino-acid N-acetyltransferase
VVSWIQAGGVATPQGYQAAGIKAGIKPGADREDIALVYSEKAAQGAAVYTTNLVQAAPITVDREHLESGSAQAVVLNSGNANACTGGRGVEDARRMCAVAASALEMSPTDILVCSTGVIGVPLPMDVIEPGVVAAARELSPAGGAAAARAIMTTDTVPKECALELDLDGTLVRIGGMAKGSGMIAPDMATMLSVITTDALISSVLLQQLLTAAVQRSYNCITVDGDMSTNDTVIILANGAAAGAQLEPGTSLTQRFAAALEQLCRHLSKMIARDGEGATKLVKVNVCGAADEALARQLGMAVANSSLVKTAVFGNDPNWGRILCAMGYAGVPFDPGRARVSLCGVLIYGDGSGAAFDAQELSQAMQAAEVVIDIDLLQGAAAAEIFTCDLSYDYVRINAEYTT